MRLTLTVQITILSLQNLTHHIFPIFINTEQEPQHPQQPHPHPHQHPHLPHPHIIVIADHPTEGENHSCSRFPQRCVQDMAANLIIVIIE